MNELKANLQRLGVDTATLAPLMEDGADDNGVDDIYTLTMPGTEAIAQWRCLRTLVPETGHWPVLLGGEQDLETHREEIDDANEQTPGEVIGQGLKIKSQDWLARKAQAWNDEAETFSLDDYHGKWPDGNHANTKFHTLSHLPGKGKSPLYLGLVPAYQGWEVPAFLHFGGWNDCPFPEVHVSLMRDWHERYGAELVVVTHDVVEMQVARPPTTREEALSLVMEQFFYCEDIVTQGTETLERLAATLLHGTAWYFWWD